MSARQKGFLGVALCLVAGLALGAWYFSAPKEPTVYIVEAGPLRRFTDAADWPWPDGRAWQLDPAAVPVPVDEELVYAYQLEEDGDWENAARVYGHILRHRAGEADAEIAHQRAALCLHRLGHPFQAFLLLDSLLSQDPQTITLNDLMKIELRLGQLLRDQAETPDPEDGKTAEETLEQAATVFEAVLARTPEADIAAEAVWRVAETRARQGRADEAEAWHGLLRDAYAASPWVARIGRTPAALAKEEANGGDE